MDRKQVRGDYLRLVWWAHRSGVRITGSRHGVLVYQRPRWGFPGPAVLLQECGEDAEVSLRRVRLAAEVAMKEPKSRSDNQPSVVPIRDEQSSKRWPLLFEQMTCTKYETGKEREPSSLLVFLQDGSFKAMLREKNTVECLWVSARGFLPLLDVIEAELASEAPDWRPDRREAGQRAPRKGKAS